MKLSGVILIVLGVGLIFALVGSIVSDMETQYPDVVVNKSWSTEYDYSVKINDSMSLLKREFEVITDEETGWFAKIGVSIAAIPTAILTMVSVVFKTMIYGTTVFTSVGTKIGIPDFVINIGIIALLVLIVFALISFFQGQKT